MKDEDECTVYFHKKVWDQQSGQKEYVDEFEELNATCIIYIQEGTLVRSELVKKEEERR